MTKNIKTKKILKQVQNDKNVETGRSMTEMLGVLAVIGVLSIGGIAGYTYAMERHETNEILNAASQRAIVIASQIAAGRQVSLKEFDGQKVAGGTFDGEVNTDTEGEFGIKVTGVKESVCQKLLKATEGTDIVLAKTDGADLTEADCAGGSFLITYSNDLGKGGEGDPIVCDESEKVTKQYFTGTCCTVKTEGKFCLEETIPTCVIAETDVSSCIASCPGDVDSSGHCCYDDAGESSEECCKMNSVGGAGLDKYGKCCFGAAVDAQGNCCETYNDSNACCIASRGVGLDWNDECCIGSWGNDVVLTVDKVCASPDQVDIDGKYCMNGVDSNKICCDNRNASEECCRMAFGSYTNWDEVNKKCCDTDGNCY